MLLVNCACYTGGSNITIIYDSRILHRDVEVIKFENCTSCYRIKHIQLEINRHIYSKGFLKNEKALMKPILCATFTQFQLNLFG